MLRFLSAVVGLIVVLSMVGIPEAAFAQSTSSTSSSEAPTYGWMDYRLGRTTPRGVVAAFGPFNHVRPPHLFQVKLVAGGYEGESVDRGYAGVAGLYGRTTEWALGRASVSTGLSVGGEGPLWGENGQVVVGLPVEATVHFAPPRYAVLGLEVGFRANLNPVQPYAGIIVGVAVGELR